VDDVRPVYLDAAGRAPRPDGVLPLPGLAATYRRVVDEAEAAGPDRDRQLEAARDAWYRGFVAEAIGRFCTGTAWADGTGRRHGGLLVADDLADWHPSVEEPARLAYRDVEVLKCGPWSQGPVMLQQLALLGELDDDALGPRPDPEVVHRLIEVHKLAFADREAWYGDPLFTDVPLADLLSPGYAAERRALLTDDADVRLRPGRPGGLVPRMPSLADYDGQGAPRVGLAPPAAFDPVDGGLLAGEGEPTVRSTDPGPTGPLGADGPLGPTGQPSAGGPLGAGGPRGDTCHLDVVDARGLMISATPSGGWLQSSPVVPELGFPLGTRAQMFWLQDGVASGLVPGARPRTTLTPSLALRNGRPWLSFGTPGGDQQDQWSLVFLLRVLATSRQGRLAGLQAAVDAPMLHSDHAPSSFHPRRAAPGRVVLEDRWPRWLVADLVRRGHDVVRVPGWSLGRLGAVGAEPGAVAAAPGTAAAVGWLRGAADPRGAQGYAVGR
jgi:gamma-glutamyltranspeptidase/glutathione hydrolase